MIIRGATLIDGTGAPPRGPVDIFIEDNRIVAIRTASPSKTPSQQMQSTADTAFELEAKGMYVLPGLIDLHIHSPDFAPDMSYFYKLLLGHGVTSIRTVFDFGSSDFALSEQARSRRNEITAPRIFTYQVPGLGGTGWSGEANTPERARLWVRWAAKRGVDGVGESAGSEPDIIRAAADEARLHRMGVAVHLPQTLLPELNARQAGEAGVRTLEHFYGHFDALLKSASVPNYPSDYNFGDEVARWKQVPNILDDIYERGSPQWTAYLEAQKKLGVIFDPTFTQYEVMRNFTAAYNAEWHDRYDLPLNWDYQQSGDRSVHGISYYDWSSYDEARWRRFIRTWMDLVNDYKNIGGRVTLGSDASSGFYATYGVATIQELMRLQEAGFSALEAIRSATLYNAEALYEPKGEAPPIGEVRVGRLADLIVVKENPLADFNTLLGTGALRQNPATGKFERIGGVSYTIKDGVVYDAKKLLADVESMVAAEKHKLGRPDRLPRF